MQPLQRAGNVRGLAVTHCRKQGVGAGLVPARAANPTGCCPGEAITPRCTCRTPIRDSRFPTQNGCPRNAPRRATRAAPTSLVVSAWMLGGSALGGTRAATRAAPTARRKRARSCGHALLQTGCRGKPCACPCRKSDGMPPGGEPSHHVGRAVPPFAIRDSPGPPLAARLLGSWSLPAALAIRDTWLSRRFCVFYLLAFATCCSSRPLVAARTPAAMRNPRPARSVGRFWRKETASSSSRIPLSLGQPRPRS